MNILQLDFERLTRVIPEDELQNVEMAEEERRQKNQDLKIKRRDYTGYDDDEFTEGSLGMKQSILAKYDEELEGPQDSVSTFFSYSHISSYAYTLPRQGFRLGSAIVSKKVKQEEEKRTAAAAVNKSLLSIEYSSQYPHPVRLYLY